MKTFELLEHTADVRLYARGGTLEELFESALEGLCSILRSDYKSLAGEPAESVSLNIESLDESALIVDFLSEALSAMYTNEAIYNKVKFEELKDKSLKCVLSGVNADGFHEDVKAVTYHGAEIKRNVDGDWEVTIVPDI